MQRRLNDSVLLRVKSSANLLPLTRGNAQLLPQTADDIAVAQAPWRSVVSRGEHTLVAHDDSAHMATQASGSRRHLTCHPHEIFIPRWSHRLNTNSSKADAVTGITSWYIPRIASAYWRCSHCAEGSRRLCNQFISDQAFTVQMNSV